MLVIWNLLSYDSVIKKNKKKRINDGRVFRERGIVQNKWYETSDLDNHIEKDKCESGKYFGTSSL